MRGLSKLTSFRRFTVFFLSIYQLFLLLRPSSGLIEAPDGSVCFNNCSGHGDCIDYSCHCHEGYDGDDCSVSFALTPDDVIPILSVGDYLLSKKNFTQTISKHRLLLVGFSSQTCHKCIAAENEYQKVVPYLSKVQLKFARADAVTLNRFITDLDLPQLPALVLYKKQQAIVYRGAQSAEAIEAFVKKQVGPPVVQLKRPRDVEDFLASRNDPGLSLSTSVVVGFFSEHEDVEEDDYEDFIDAAKQLQGNADIYVGVVTSKSTCDHFKISKHIDRTPSMLMVDSEGAPQSVNLDEFYGDKLNIKDWIVQHSIPVVGKLTGNNFPMYEKLNLPMLLMFLDLENEHQTSSPGRVVGGKSGGILNEHLLEEFRAVAKEHSKRIAFVYLDGNEHVDKMKSLGLYGGKERLPSLAFNTKDGKEIPFPESLPINQDTLLQFCADFISGKLKSASDAAEMAKKALQSAIPINKKNTAVRKEKLGAPEAKTGVSEQFGDGNAGDDAVTLVTLKNFEEVVIDDDKDVMLMLHAKSCEPCAHFSVYYKRMAGRFRDLNISTLDIARMDVTEESPPPSLNLIRTNLPILVLFPAATEDLVKQSPIFYSGVGKVQPMMKWVEKYVTKKFSLPNLPHLTEAQVEMYKQQVREREIALEEKRLKEKEDVEEEDRKRLETLERAKKLAESKITKQNPQEEQDVSDEDVYSAYSNDAEL